MKLLCETTDNFMLIDYFNGGDTVESYRPCVVRPSQFFQMHAAAHRLRIIAQVNDEATDQEFLSYLKDAEDEELAVASFVDAYPLEQVEKPKATVGRPRKGS